MPLNCRAEVEEVLGGQVSSIPPCLNNPSGFLFFGTVTVVLKRTRFLDHQYHPCRDDKSCTFWFFIAIPPPPPLVVIFTPHSFCPHLPRLLVLSSLHCLYVSLFPLRLLLVCSFLGALWSGINEPSVSPRCFSVIPTAPGLAAAGRFPPTTVSIPILE